MQNRVKKNLMEKQQNKMKKLVQESLNEKFKEESDPVHDLGIGMPEYHIVVIDPDDNAEIIGEQFSNALNKFGIYLVKHELDPGSDLYVYILSDRKLTPRQFKYISKELNYEEDEE